MTTSEWKEVFGMKIIQVIPDLHYGDAVGNDAMALCDVIAGMGYETGIYANIIDKRVASPLYHKMSKLPKLRDDDIVILNHCSGSELCYKFAEMKGRKMMIYHNITPARFFEPYDRQIAANIERGYEQTRYLSDKVEYVMPVSEYNASDLKEMGYTCPMYTRPILIPFEDYEKKYDEDIVKKYSDDGYVNIIFLGRVVPNKKHEDVIKTFAYYKKHINPKSRLILVGSDGGAGDYKQYLERYVEALMVDDVIFTGHTSFACMLAYYRIADVFLCMSEHEGFCVPLVESMYFDVPIVAYDSSAISSTLGGSGILMKEKDPVLASMLIDRVVKDKAFREHVIAGQRKRLSDFSYEKIKEKFIQGISNFIDGSI